MKILKNSTEDMFLKQKWQAMKMTKPLCDYHQQPVIKFSYPFIQFGCRDCYEELPDNSNVYSMDELNLPVDRLYGTLLKYIDGGKIPMLEKYHTEYEVDFDEYLKERKKYCLESEMEQFRKAVVEVKLELKVIWDQVQEMFEEYRILKLFKDYETMILMHQKWAPIGFDFKDKYMNKEYVWSTLNRLSDEIMRSIYMKTEFCGSCLTEPAKFTCNNLMDQKGKICKSGSRYGKLHEYYGRLHESRYIKKGPIYNVS